MELAMVGLGRMGANLVRRLLRDGHRCVVYDVDPAAVAALSVRGRGRRRQLRGPGRRDDRSPPRLGDGARGVDHRAA